MGNPLLDRALPRELAARSQVIEKTEKLETFPRLARAVGEDLRRLPEDRLPGAWRQAPVALRLAFGWADDRARVPALTGRATADVPAVCQRCLEPFTLALEQALGFLLAGPDEGLAGREGYEVWELDEPFLRPADIVDEVLLMAMPLSAMHADPGDCGPLARRLAPDGEGAARPFAGLRSQMRRKD